MVAAAGADPLAVALIEAHQRPPTPNPSPVKREGLSEDISPSTIYEQIDRPLMALKDDHSPSPLYGDKGTGFDHLLTALQAADDAN